MKSEGSSAICGQSQRFHFGALCDKASCLVLLRQPSVTQLAHKSHDNNDWCRISTQHTPTNWRNQTFPQVQFATCRHVPFSPPTHRLVPLRSAFIVLSKCYNWWVSWTPPHLLPLQTPSAHSNVTHHLWSIVCALSPPTNGGVARARNL